jgi:Spy/CpxP family protein refolding chaperone
MKRSLALVSVLGLFLLGIVVGALGMHLYDARHPFPPPPRDSARQELHLNRLEELLDLTPEQRTRIEEIHEQSRAEADALHESMLPEVRAHMARTRERIEEVLTPEQREKFRELAERQRARFERFVLDGPRPGPPRGGRGRRQPPPPPSD